MERKFYRSTYRVEVLSEEPVKFDSLADMHEAITTGDCSGQVSTFTENQEVNAKEMANLLVAQGSDPGFFQITEDGEDEN